MLSHIVSLARGRRISINSSFSLSIIISIGLSIGFGMIIKIVVFHWHSYSHSSWYGFSNVIRIRIITILSILRKSII